MFFNKKKKEKKIFYIYQKYTKKKKKLWNQNWKKKKGYVDTDFLLMIQNTRKLTFRFPLC